MENELAINKQVDSPEREPSLGIACAQKGGGKTYTTLKEQIRNSITGCNGTIKRRRVLILDSNDEYGNVQSDHKNPDFPHVKGLSLPDLKLWLKQPNIEARRISVVKSVAEGGGKRNSKELQETLSEILKYYNNGLLIIEDLTNYVSDSLPSDLIGTLISQRHRSVDVIIHFQSLGKAAHPKLWANCNWLRLHKLGDTVAKNEKKLEGTDLTPLYIAEKMINIQYDKGNNGFCVYYHKNTSKELVGKIRGGFSQRMFNEGAQGFLEDNMNIVEREVKRKHLWTGQLVHKDRAMAIEFLLKDYLTKYYGNPDRVSFEKPTQPKKITRPESLSSKN